MKIAKKYLLNIINEEVDRLLSERTTSDGWRYPPDLDKRIQKIETSLDKLLDNSAVRAALGLDKFYDDASAEVGKVVDDFKDPHYAFTKYKNKLDKWIYDDYDETAKKVKNTLDTGKSVLDKWIYDNYDDVAKKVIETMKDPQLVKDVYGSIEDLFGDGFKKITDKIKKHPQQQWNKVLAGGDAGTAARDLTTPSAPFP